MLSIYKPDKFICKKLGSGTEVGSCQWKRLGTPGGSSPQGINSKVFIPPKAGKYPVPTGLTLCFTSMWRRHSLMIPNEYKCAQVWGAHRPFLKQDNHVPLSFPLSFVIFTIPIVPIPWFSSAIISFIHSNNHLAFH